MLKFLDDFLNSITMYWLVLYTLIFLVLAALVFCVAGILPFNPIKFTFSTVLLIFVCLVTNTIFSKIFKAAVNFESIYITSLILALIITPINFFSDILFIAAAGFLAAASKFLIASKRKHIFNPAAFGVLAATLFFNDYASWWISSGVMLPFVFIGGLLITWKLRKWSLVITFLFVSVILIAGSKITNEDLPGLIQRVFLQSPVLFFATVMLTEPQTTPPLRRWQIFYGAVVGILFSIPNIRIANYYLTPEAALLVGNIFSYLVSPKGKLNLKLKEKKQLSKDIFEFIYQSEKFNTGFKFLAGQYMEWTLPHKNPDSRGERRYFTIASSPTEDKLRIGIRFFFQKSSSFKKALFNLKTGDTISAGSLSGEFILPRNKQKKLCFIAGGIGVTPFRSMLKYLIDTKDKRDIILFYGAKDLSDFVYGDVLKQAAIIMKTKVVRVLTEPQKNLKDWKGKIGYIDKRLISEEVPDYKERIFYISGPHSMVDSINTTLKQMSIPPGDQIKEDFFPGYA